MSSDPDTPLHADTDARAGTPESVIPPGLDEATGTPTRATPPGETESPGPSGAAARPRDAHPALRNLNNHQRRAFDEFTAGFADRRQLLEWMLRFQYCSFGRLADRIYFTLADTHERTALASVLEEPARTRYSPAHDLTDAEVEHARHRLRSRYLRPAALAAYRELRTKATEYVVDANAVPDPDKAAFFALRPAFEDYFALQRVALTGFLNGFCSITAVEEWFQRLDHATWGEIRNVPGGDHLEHRMLSQRAARRVLVDNGAVAAREREQLAARYLLPATNRCVRALAAVAGESSDQRREEHGAPTG